MKCVNFAKRQLFCMYTCICIYTHVHAHIQVGGCVHGCVYMCTCVCRSVCACVHRAMSSIPGRSESLGSRDCQSLGDPYIPLQFSTAARGLPKGDTSTGPCRSGTAWRSSLDDPAVGSPLSLRASSYLGVGLAQRYPALLQRLIPWPLAVLPEYCLGLENV